jgi:hypothetical protein
MIQSQRVGRSVALKYIALKMQRAGREARPLSPPLQPVLRSLMYLVADWRCARPTETWFLETAPVPNWNVVS